MVELRRSGECAEVSVGSGSKFISLIGLLLAGFLRVKVSGTIDSFFSITVYSTRSCLLVKLPIVVVLNLLLPFPPNNRPTYLRLLDLWERELTALLLLRNVPTFSMSDKIIHT
jgi:hypothetical protein